MEKQNQQYISKKAKNRANRKELKTKTKKKQNFFFKKFSESPNNCSQRPLLSQ